MLGDEDGAAAMVREATRTALRAHDEGKPDDGLLGALLDAFGVDALGVEAGGAGAVGADAVGVGAISAGAVERLARLVNDEPTVENWAPRAPAVFAAASAGYGRALAVIEAAAAELAGWRPSRSRARWCWRGGCWDPA